MDFKEKFEEAKTSLVETKDKVVTAVKDNKGKIIIGTSAVAAAIWGGHCYKRGYKVGEHIGALKGIAGTLDYLVSKGAEGVDIPTTTGKNYHFTGVQKETE